MQVWKIKNKKTGRRGLLELQGRAFTAIIEGKPKVIGGSARTASRWMKRKGYEIYHEKHNLDIMPRRVE
jgi:hypothetical protein